MSHNPAIELVGIDKSFGAVHANKNIHLKVEKGTIHGIIGENGAGKSTLMSILYGFYQADKGEIRINGQALTIKDSQPPFLPHRHGASTFHAGGELHGS